jgi:hypothetical protein
MFAAAKGKSTLGIPRSVGREFTKGAGPMPASYAAGGPVIQTQASRFMKTPNVFTTDIERTNYEKKSQGGELSDMSGDSKSRPPIKPRT